MNTNWFSKASTTPEPTPQTEPPKGVFSSIKLALAARAPVTSTVSTFSEPVNNSDNSESNIAPEAGTGVFSKFSQKLKQTFNKENIANKSRNLVQGTQESMQTSINLAKHLPYIIGLCAAGGFFLFLSFMFLPVIVFFPQKFSFCFALGCSCFLGAIALVRDPQTFAMSLLKKEKLPYTIVYVIALLGTFYFSLMTHSKILSLICAFAQVVSLLWLVIISIPGGKKAFGIVSGFMSKIFKSSSKKLLNSGSGSSSAPKSSLPL